MRIFKTFLIVGLLGISSVGPLAGEEKPVSVTIHNAGLLLKGKFYAAEEAKPFATVILLPGFPGGEGDVLGLGGRLAVAGFNVLTFSYSGSYQSQGETSWPNAQRDIQAALEFVRQPDNAVRYGIDAGRVILGGWCFGGGMALSYAVKHPDMTAVFSIAGNDHGEFLREYARNPRFKLLVDDMVASWIVPPLSIRMAKGSRPEEIVAAGLEKLDPIYDLRASAAVLSGKEILLVGGWNDRQVTIDQFILPFYRALEKAQAKSVKILAFQDGHDFKNSRDELAQALIGWLHMVLEKR